MRVTLTNTTTFHDDVEQAIQQYEQIISHAASRTRQMIDRYGEVEAVVSTHDQPGSSTGF